VAGEYCGFSAGCNLNCCFLWVLTCGCAPRTACGLFLQQANACQRLELTTPIPFVLLAAAAAPIPGGVPVGAPVGGAFVPAPGGPTGVRPVGGLGPIMPPRWVVL
jgi:hypothetical protein